MYKIFIQLYCGNIDGIMNLNICFVYYIKKNAWNEVDGV